MHDQGWICRGRLGSWTLPNEWTTLPLLMKTNMWEKSAIDPPTSFFYCYRKFVWQMTAKMGDKQKKRSSLAFTGSCWKFFMFYNLCRLSDPPPFFLTFWPSHLFWTNLTLCMITAVSLRCSVTYDLSSMILTLTLTSHKKFEIMKLIFIKLSTLCTWHCFRWIIFIINTIIQ